MRTLDRLNKQNDYTNLMFAEVILRNKLYIQMYV